MAKGGRESDASYAVSGGLCVQPELCQRHRISARAWCGKLHGKQVEIFKDFLQPLLTVSKQGFSVVREC